MHGETYYWKGVAGKLATWMPTRTALEAVADLYEQAAEYVERGGEWHLEQAAEYVEAARSLEEAADKEASSYRRLISEAEQARERYADAERERAA